MQKATTLLAILPLYLCLQASSWNGSLSLGHNGKSKVSLSFASSLSKEEFQKSLDRKIDGYNISSGYSDAVTLKSLQEAGEGKYQVQLALRRLDKVKINGVIAYSSWKDFAIEGSEARKAIENAEKGNLSMNTSAYYDGSLATISVTRDSRIPLRPVDVDGKSLTAAEFLGKSSEYSNKAKMVFFRCLDMEGLEKLEVSVPGTLKFRGGEGVEFTSKNSLIITPVSFPITITKTIKYVEDGIEKTKTVVEKKESANNLAGYFVYEPSMSPFEITLITLGCALGAGLIASFLIYILRLGKKQIALEEGKHD